MHLTLKRKTAEVKKVKIALRGKGNTFTDALLARLQKKLAADQVVFWATWDDSLVKDAEVLLGAGQVGAEEMDALPKLGLIQTISDGYDAVDVEAATERGIWVSYAPGEETGNADSVAEYAVLLILAATRRVGIAQRSIMDRKVERPMLNQAMFGMSVCVVGWGSIGERVGDRLRSFGVTLSAVDRKPEVIPEWVKAWPLEKLNEALGAADVTVVCLRGTEENEHLFDAERFAAMKRGAMLVNVARGTLVDENALLEALQIGQIAGAGLDVEEHEPVRADNPLQGLPQVFVTPHIAGFTTYMLEGTIDYVERVLAQYKDRERMKSLLNEPKHPRVVLRAQKFVRSR